MIATARAFSDRPPITLRPATFFPGVGRDEPLLRDWLRGHRELMFRWTLGQSVDETRRREFAQSAVAIQRLRGDAEFLGWLFGAALQAAAAEQPAGGLPERALAGLPPELRSVLRLVSHGELRVEEAVALLSQRIGYVRSRLLQTRWRG